MLSPCKTNKKNTYFTHSEHKTPKMHKHAILNIYAPTLRFMIHLTKYNRIFMNKHLRDVTYNEINLLRNWPKCKIV